MRVLHTMTRKPRIVRSYLNLLRSYILAEIMTARAELEIRMHKQWSACEGSGPREADESEQIRVGYGKAKQGCDFRKILQQVASAWSLGWLLSVNYT